MRKSLEWASAREDPPSSWARLGLPSPAAAVRQVTSAFLLRSLLFIAILSVAAVPPLDPDLWWHLSNGRLMVATATIPHADVYSFSAAGQPWVMHEWLADLGMYAVYHAGGLPLLVALFAMVVTGAATYSAESPRPARSSICILNPPTTPSPFTAGGGKTATKAS